MKISSITFKAGSAPDSAPLTVHCPNVTLLVGPNNAGKSRTLREIEAYCSGTHSGPHLLIDDLELALPDARGALEMMEIYKIETPPGHQTLENHTYYRKFGIKNSSQPILIHMFTGEGAFAGFADEEIRTVIRDNIVKFFTIFLDGRTRFDLTDPKSTGALTTEKPQNHLWSLFVDKNARLNVRKFTEDAFGKYFVIDPTGMNLFEIRLSSRAPCSEREEQSLDTEARAFHSQADRISDLGDGVKTSVGLVSAVMCLPDRIILIDEPEAFLHPTLARRVGSKLSETARERDATLVASTHSSDFLLGCIQTSPELRIVRLTYEGGQAAARSLDPTRVRDLVADPLLRSAHAMRGLFHRAVVVCEADSDRAFYDEINSRMATLKCGIDDVLFLNAQNWQTIPRIVMPLRRLGVPAAAIVDFDVLMDDQFAKLWAVVDVNNTNSYQFLRRRRSALAEKMRAVGSEKCKELGVLALDQEHRKDALELIEAFAQHGLFVVDVGELECWLSGVNGITRLANKTKWLLNAFEAMGSDPHDLSFVRPGSDDVWRFISGVKAWTDNPTRRGIPL